MSMATTETFPVPPFRLMLPAGWEEVPADEAAVRALVERSSEVFRSVFGWHIARVYGRKPSGVRPLAEVREADTARVGQHQPGDDLDRGGLARAVGFQQAEDFAAFHAQAQVVDGNRGLPAS